MTHRSKIATLMILLLAAGLLLCACNVSSSGSFAIRNQRHHMKEGDIANSYEYFNGTRTYSLKIKEGATLKISVTNTSGALGVSVSGPKGTVLSESPADGSYDIPITDEGSWSVALTASDHQGSYSITW